jgi:hypothetical protein
MESKDLWVELQPGKPSCMVLRGTYGQKVNQTFRMSRQGVRWRFWHIFNCAYMEAFSTILFIEKVFGTELREHAIRISKERYGMRQDVRENGFQSADSLVVRREQATEPADGPGAKLTSELPAEPAPSGHEGKPV